MDGKERCARALWEIHMTNGGIHFDLILAIDSQWCIHRLISIYVFFFVVKIGMFKLSFILHLATVI
jgi:hypothetical protein